MSLRKEAGNTGDLQALGRTLAQVRPVEAGLTALPPIDIDGKKVRVPDPKLREMLILVLTKGQAGIPEEEMQAISKKYPEPDSKFKNVKMEARNDMNRLNTLLRAKRIDRKIEIHPNPEKKDHSGIIYFRKTQLEPKQEITAPDPAKDKPQNYQWQDKNTAGDKTAQPDFNLAKVPAEPEKDPQSQLIDNLTTRALYEIATPDLDIKMLKETLTKTLKDLTPKGLTVESIIGSQNLEELVTEGVKKRLEKLWKGSIKNPPARDLYDLGLKDKALQTHRREGEEIAAKQIFLLLFAENFQSRFAK